MGVSVAEVKAFKEDATKCRDNWLRMAKNSWNELKKRLQNNRIFYSTPNSLKRKARYPTWYSIYKVRQSLVLSRKGQVLCRDTTKDGNDPIGAAAAIIKERLATNLAKAIPFLDTMMNCRDDFLATDFAMSRAYYERDMITEKVKHYIYPEQDPQTGDMIFIDDAGEEVYEDEIMQDDQGFFIEEDEAIEVAHEKVCLEHVLYKNIYIDSVAKWPRVKRIMFEEQYSEWEFKEIFGTKAFLELSMASHDKAGIDEAAKKKENITVYEYWDLWTKECLWLPEDGDKFIKPKKYSDLGPDDEDDMVGRNGLYDLEKFFPVTEPLIVNAPTDEFWPIPEYYQLMEIFEDVHSIFTRMFMLTRIIRTRILYDSSVEGLDRATNELSEGDAIGIANLVRNLSANNGSIENAVQYFPVQKAIEALNQLYVALEQRLNTIYKLTGHSDLLQGLISDPTQRTLGERQMLEKYALNQIEERQAKMAEFVRQNYELLVEMALKNFSDESLAKYIMPETLQPEQQQVFWSAIGMLRDDNKRFRIDLETDSTIALNEQYQKQMAIELVNALTGSIEKVATVAKDRPALVAIELHAMKFLVQQFPQGKIFQEQITQSIDNVIEGIQKEQPGPDPMMLQMQAEEKKNQMTFQLKIMELNSTREIEIAKLNQNERIEAIGVQLEQMKQASENQKVAQELQLSFNELVAEINKTREEMALKRDALMVEMQKIADKKDVETFKAMLDQQAQSFEQQLLAADQKLEEYKVVLDEKEKYMTEARLQDEHKLNKMQQQIEIVKTIKEAQPAQQNPQISISMPEQKPMKVTKRHKFKRDGEGNAIEVETEESHDVPIG